MLGCRGFCWDRGQVEVSQLHGLSDGGFPENLYIPNILKNLPEYHVSQRDGEVAKEMCIFLFVIKDKKAITHSIMQFCVVSVCYGCFLYNKDNKKQTSSMLISQQQISQLAYINWLMLICGGQSSILTYFCASLLHPLFDPDLLV